MLNVAGGIVFGMWLGILTGVTWRLLRFVRTYSKAVNVLMARDMDRLSSEDSMDGTLFREVMTKREDGQWVPKKWEK